MSCETFNTAGRILCYSFTTWHLRDIWKSMPSLNQSELQVFMGDKQNFVACDLTQEEKWVVTCDLTKNTSEFGCFGETLFLCFDLWSSAWGIQALQTGMSNTKYPSDFLRQVCLLQHSCIIECLSWNVQTFSVLPAKCFCRRLHTIFLVSVCYDWEKIWCMDELVWKANLVVHDSFLTMFTKWNACKIASYIDLSQVRSN